MTQSRPLGLYDVVDDQEIENGIRTASNIFGEWVKDKLNYGFEWYWATVQGSYGDFFTDIDFAEESTSSKSDIDFAVKEDNGEMLLEK